MAISSDGLLKVSFASSSLNFGISFPRKHLYRRNVSLSARKKSTFETSQALTYHRLEHIGNYFYHQTRYNTSESFYRNLNLSKRFFTVIVIKRQIFESGTCFTVSIKLATRPLFYIKFTINILVCMVELIQNHEKMLIIILLNKWAK